MIKFLKRVLFLLALLFFSSIIYFSYNKKERNPYTKRRQIVYLSQKQEVFLGLNSAPHLAINFGGLHPNSQYQQIIDQIGAKLVNNSIAKQSGYPFEFHLLRDERTINAFALPGGQIFITMALLRKLTNENKTLNEDMVASVLSHEIGHVLGKHSNERITHSFLGINEDKESNFLINFFNNIKTIFIKLKIEDSQLETIEKKLMLKNSHRDELESDALAVQIMFSASYNPNYLINLMNILKEEEKKELSSDLKDTHPSPENRIEKIKEAIRKYGR